MMAFDHVLRLRSIELNEKIKDQFLINVNQAKWIKESNTKIMNHEDWISDSSRKLNSMYQN